MSNATPQPMDSPPAPPPVEAPLGTLAPLRLVGMPAYAGLLVYIGPGVLWAALAQGSGERSGGRTSPPSTAPLSSAC
jgi:hypothetical protein